MRLILAIIFWISSLWAYQYNSFLLKTQADLYPKILLFDKKLDEKIDDGVIDFAIIYEGVDRFTAQTLAKKINERYPKVDRFALRARAVNVWRYLADKKRSVDALYVLKLSKSSCKKVAKKAIKSQTVTFVYDLEDLRCGFLVGIDIEREVHIYLNKKVLLEGQYDFVEDFYLMVRFVE